MGTRVTRDTLEAYLACLAPEDRLKVQHMSVDELLDLIQRLLDKKHLKPLSDDGPEPMSDHNPEPLTDHHPEPLSDHHPEPMPNHNGGYLNLLPKAIVKATRRVLVLGVVLYLGKLVLPLLLGTDSLTGLLTPPVPTWVPIPAWEPGLHLNHSLQEAQEMARKALKPSLDPFEVHITSGQLDLAMYNMRQLIKDAWRMWGTYSDDVQGCHYRDQLIAVQAGLLAASWDMATLDLNLTRSLRGASHTLEFTTQEFLHQVAAPDTDFAIARTIWDAVRREPQPPPAAEMRKRALWDTVCTGRRRLMTIAEKALDGAGMVKDRLIEPQRIFDPTRTWLTIELENRQAAASASYTTAATARSDEQNDWEASYVNLWGLSPWKPVSWTATELGAQPQPPLDTDRFDAAVGALRSLEETKKHMLVAFGHLDWVQHDLIRLHRKLALPAGESGHELHPCEVDPADPVFQAVRSHTSPDVYLNTLRENWAALAHSLRNWREKDWKHYIKVASQDVDGSKLRDFWEHYESADGARGYVFGTNS
ncbi:hypothetical protein NpPPO83_00003732 [Neofusicoccum parvum]|uniref:Uncharacterized protein n=1 Tax=Neofusicoccum parvum TaxID=310453 RepID=A0ACB5SBP9_9PEZI|nr:hypothetical protein NpPPO83_00003732 [Neofusicoccum parvum]